MRTTMIFVALLAICSCSERADIPPAPKASAPRGDEKVPVVESSSAGDKSDQLKRDLEELKIAKSIPPTGGGGGGGGGRRPGGYPGGPTGGYPGGPTGSELVNKKYTLVTILFATDRKPSGSTGLNITFGGERAPLSYGMCKVSIPAVHNIGELESPRFWRFEFREDPEKHVVLIQTSLSLKDRFFDFLASRVHESAKESAFLFVHGYNVAFDDAAKRTAQIAYDLEFDGAPVLYSWPSQGEAAAYTVDEQNVEWAQANIRGFLEDFFVRSDAKNVYLIAHSMGNRALTRAVASLLADKPALRPRLREIILAAPDIDAEVFKRDIAPALTANGRPVTLYASSDDKALFASKKVHGYPRAGDSGQGLIVVAGIETVDATAVDTSFLGHSYFAENRPLLADISTLFQTSQRAAQRFGLRKRETSAGPYWEFKR